MSLIFCFLSTFLFTYFLPCCAACGILVPWLGIELLLLHWKRGVLTSREILKLPPPLFVCVLWDLVLQPGTEPGSTAVKAQIFATGQPGFPLLSWFSVLWPAGLHWAWKGCPLQSQSVPTDSKWCTQECPFGCKLVTRRPHPQSSLCWTRTLQVRLPLPSRPRPRSRPLETALCFRAPKWCPWANPKPAQLACSFLQRPRWKLWPSFPRIPRPPDRRWRLPCPPPGPLLGDCE